MQEANYLNQFWTIQFSSPNYESANKIDILLPTIFNFEKCL